MLSSLHKPGADAHEQDALLGVLGVVLGHRHIQCSLADGVGPRNLNLVLCDHVDVSVASAQRDHLLRRPLQDEGDVGVVEVDVANDIDPEVIQKVLLQLLRLLGTFVSGDILA